MPRSAKNPKLNTREARSLYLVGDESGVRITDPKEIARRTGCHERTIRDYIKTQWQVEREEMLMSVHDGSLVMGLNEETLDKANHDEKFLRQRMDDLKLELSEVNEIEEKLFNLLDSVDQLVDLPPKKFESLVNLLQKYLDTNASKKAITTQFLQVKKAWDAASGIESRLKAGETALKAIASTQAKHEALEAIERSKGQSRNVTPGQDGEDSRLAAFDR